MRADYINPILHSIMDTLTRITHCVPCPGKIKVKKHELSQGIVTGLVNLQINEEFGSIALSFSQDLILNIASEQQHQVQYKIDHSMLNMAGRITHMACQGAREYLSQHSDIFMLSNPKVFLGFRQKIHHCCHQPKLMVQFETPAGICFSEFSFAQMGEVILSRH